MREVALIGAGMTRFGDRMDKGARELFSEAFEEALGSVDRGLDRGEIELAYVGNQGIGGGQLGLISTLVAEAAGLTGIGAARIESACASGTYALIAAATAIAAGVCDVALAGGVEKIREISGREVRGWMGTSGNIEWERLAGLTFPGVYAMAAVRHMDAFGLRKEQLAMVAVKNHENGSLNSKAHLRNRVTLDQVMASPTVCHPLGVFDCCPTSDGGSAVILAAAEVASRYTDRPVYLAGFGTGTDSLAVSNRADLLSLGAVVRAAQNAYGMAGIGPRDVQVAEVHDCFTIAELISYADLGFCDRGEAQGMIERGETRVGGRIPVNTSGGLKSKGHPIGATGCAQVYTIFKQLRGEAGPVQVDGAEIGLTHNVGGFGGSAAVCVFRRSR